MPRKVESGLRRALSHWLPWVVVAWLGVIGVAVYGWTLNARTLRDEAIREAETMSRRDAAVARCLESRPILLRFSNHVKGVNDFTKTLVVNSAAVLQQTPTSDPQYEVRRKNLIRLLHAREDIRQVVSFPVPSVSDCKQRIE